MSGDFLDTSEHSEHFPDRMDVQQKTPGALDGRGASEPGTWTNATGLTALPVLKVARTGEEVPVIEGAEKRVAISTHDLIMQDYYPAITEQMRGVIDGEVYEFLLCDHEGMKTVGIIKAKRVGK